MPHSASHAERASTLQLINFTSFFMLREQDNGKSFMQDEKFLGFTSFYHFIET